MSNSFIPALIFIGLIVVFGALIPFIISSWIDTSIPDTNSLVYKTFVTYIENGIDIPIVNFNFDLFFWANQEIKDSINGYFNAMTYYPDYISIPLIIILIVCFIYAIAGFIPTLG